jgi:hypothetical protein
VSTKSWELHLPPDAVNSRNRPSPVGDEGLLWGISPRSLELNISCQELRAPTAQSTLVLA